MAFQTYQCEQYRKYLDNHDKELEKIYTLISGAPFSKTSIARVAGYSYHAYHYRFTNRLLTSQELKNILNFIK